MEKRSFSCATWQAVNLHGGQLSIPFYPKKFSIPYFSRKRAVVSWFWTLTSAAHFGISSTELTIEKDYFIAQKMYSNHETNNYEISNVHVVYLFYKQKRLNKQSCNAPLELLTFCPYCEPFKWFSKWIYNKHIISKGKDVFPFIHSNYISVVNLRNVHNNDRNKIAVAQKPDRTSERAILL